MDSHDSSADLSADLEALQAVVKALQPLSAEARHRVIQSALTILGHGTGAVDTEPDRDSGAPATGTQPEPKSPIGAGPVANIRSLREQKDPRSAIQMATLVAYYLSEVAPKEERKVEVGEEDIVKYFKQANFKLPASARMALINAKNAGYLDPKGSGRYALNPVGHNLIAHTLPRDTGSVSRPAKPRKSSKSKSRKGRKATKRNKAR